MMLGLTGVAVVIAVQSIAIYMIVNANVNLKRACVRENRSQTDGE